MKTIIFKSEKNAKVYEIRSAKAQGIYAAGELIRTVRTDNIEKVLENSQYIVTATEIDETPILIERIKRHTERALNETRGYME